MTKVMNQPAADTAPDDVIKSFMEELRDREPETLPAVECTPWCKYGNGHTDEIHPDDQHCWSDHIEVELPSQPIVNPGKAWASRDGLELYLGKKATHVAAKVYAEQLSKGMILELTRTEALALSEALRELAERM